MPVDRSSLSGTGVSEAHAPELLDFVDSLEQEIGGIEQGVADLQQEVALIQQELEATQIESTAANATLEALTTSYREVPLFPFNGNRWELRTTVAANTVISTSKNAIAEGAGFPEKNAGQKDRAVIRAKDSLGAPLVLRIYFFPLGLIGSVTTPGDGVLRDYTITFSAPVVGPGIFFWYAQTPNVNGLWEIDRVRIFDAEA